MNQQNQQNQYYSQPRLKRFLFTTENLFKLIYIISTLFKFHPYYIGIVPSILAIIRRKNIHNEFPMNILYLLNLSFFNSTLSFMYHFPITIHYSIGISEYLQIREGTLLENAKKYVIVLTQSKDYFLKFRFKYEILLFLIISILVIFSNESYVFCILHALYLITKYYASQYSQPAIKELLRLEI